MSFLDHFHKTSEKSSTVPVSCESGSTAVQSESIGTILGKVSIVWAGLFAGITLGDVVLFATLIYTLLQIALTIYERIVKPWHSAHVAALVAKATTESSNGQTGPQEK